MECQPSGVDLYTPGGFETFEREVGFKPGLTFFPTTLSSQTRVVRKKLVGVVAVMVVVSCR